MAIECSLSVENDDDCATERFLRSERRGARFESQ